jgi:hypothetical protein
MVRRYAALAVAVLGCQARNPDFCPGGEDERGECSRPDASLCFGAAPFAFCLTEAPTSPLAVTHVDTNAGCTEVITLGRELCLVMGTDVTVSQRVTVNGTRPLVLFGMNRLTVEASGVLDASGTATAGGPGADLGCDASGTNGKSGSSGGGGAGGSFGGRGGGGGNGGSGNVGGMAAQAVPAPSVLQGGCSGTNGGAGTGAIGDRGFGGGGVYLVAGDTLEILGTVIASGAGGRRGLQDKGGGGGGGSGGMIVLFAPMMTVTAATRIFANGGGGGGGADGSTDGMDGATPSEPLSAALGGSGGGGAGKGGAGAFGSTGAMPGTMSGDGGGGGGGGVGFVYRLGGNVSVAQISPPAI